MLRRLLLSVLTPPLALSTCAALAVGTAALVSPTAAGAATVSSRVSYPLATRTLAVARSSAGCAVDVRRFTTADPSADDTAAFTEAMRVAVETHPRCHRYGPSGAPQAVVYVPPGTYRLANLYFPSNLRMEVSAAATLQEPANRPAVPTQQWVPMIQWDTRVKGLPPVRNVSLVGVGSALTADKLAMMATAGPALRSWNLAHDFTMNLDPARTGSTNYNPGMNLVNVAYFRIENVFSIQNNRNQYTRKVTPWPTSSRAVLELHARKDSPIGTGPFVEPKHGLVLNHVNTGGPRGYGPNQINAAQYVTFRNVFTRGGTALRIETDGSTNGRGVPKRGATVDHLYASNIVGQNCNRAVSLSPHGQRNGYVDVSGVWAYSCNQAVVAAVDKHIPAHRRGAFRAAYVRNTHVVSGAYAQLDATRTLWRTGRSYMPVWVVPGLRWHPHIYVVARAGSFTKG